MRRFFSVNSTYSATISIVSEFNVKSVLQSKAFVKKKLGYIDLYFPLSGNSQQTREKVWSIAD